MWKPFHSLGRGDCFIAVESASYCHPHQARTNPRHQGEREVVRWEDNLQNGRVRLPDLWRHQSTNRRVYWKAYWERGTANKPHTQSPVEPLHCRLWTCICFSLPHFITMCLCVKILCRAFYKYVTPYFMSSFVHIPDCDRNNQYHTSYHHICNIPLIIIQIIDKLTMTIRGKNIRTWITLD